MVTWSIDELGPGKVIVGHVPPLQLGTGAAVQFGSDTSAGQIGVPSQAPPVWHRFGGGPQVSPMGSRVSAQPGVTPSHTSATSHTPPLTRQVCMAGRMVQ